MDEIERIGGLYIQSVSIWVSCKGSDDDKISRQMPNMHRWSLFLRRHGNKAMVL
ncbi:hypothetical protein MTR_5g035370 [Medicago truncatula]|uniref:Uncharacterized protein n=1 Tax=Medicago truncatula TaxID=3880 RepID=G7K444_MEDTR|nr:hypothetical protein MTR_5g035370 [Medicago truncatula]